MDTQAVNLPVEPVDEALSITPQLSAEDMRAASAAGFRSIINNRPDFEGGPSQPRSAELEAAARAAGLQYRHLPVPPSGHSDADARRMADLVEGMPKPVLAFCRSGRRSAALYQKGRSVPRGSRG
ncbi:MAG TPA: TIGR01244 family sulfur transferase [Ramlibacter sp.]